MKKILFAVLPLVLLFCANAYAERIVSLSPGITEILFAIGAGDEVVGDTDFCNYPPEALKKPKVGSGFRPSPERIISMRPTLVLGSVEGAERNLKTYLESFGIKNEFYRSTDAKDIIESIRSISDLLHIDSSVIMKELESLFYKETTKVHTGLFIVGINPLAVAGEGTFVSGIMSCAGVRNVIDDGFKGYPLISHEYLLLKSPDYIFIAGSMGESACGDSMAGSCCCISAPPTWSAWSRRSRHAAQ